MFLCFLIHKLIFKHLRCNQRGRLHVDDERMSDRRENLFLVLDVIDLFQLEHFGDGQHLECEVILAWCMLDKNDSPECTRPWSTNIHTFTGSETQTHHGPFQGPYHLRHERG